MAINTNFSEHHQLDNVTVDQLIETLLYINHQAKVKTTRQQDAAYEAYFMKRRAQEDAMYEDALELDAERL